MPKIPPRSYESKLVEQKMLEVPENGVVTYAEMKDVTGVSCRPGEKGYGYVQTAIRAIRSENQILFINVKNVGWKRATAPETCGRIERRARHIYRQSGETLKDASTVDFSKANQEEKTRLNVTISQAALLKHLTGGPTVKKIASIVNQTQRQIPVAKLLENLRNGNSGDIK